MSTVPQDGAPPSGTVGNSGLVSRVLYEPLVHFLAIAAGIFVVYGALNPAEASRPDRIIISQAKVEQLAGLFLKTWQRPPAPQELKRLVDDQVMEEILVREALALGLDKDDTVIRRRLRLKMEFLGHVSADVSTPTDAELTAFMATHADRFREEPRTAFQQVLVSGQAQSEQLKRQATATLASLRADENKRPSGYGDPTLLPTELPLTSKSAVAQTFGAEFADSLAALSPGAWSGPVASSYGLHLVRVIDRNGGRLPQLSEVRDMVQREWSNEQRKRDGERRNAALLARYKVEIEGVDSPLAAP